MGSDIALANAMAREIIHAGLEHKEFIARATVGFEDYRAKVESYTLEYAERETGVPAELIRELAHAYAKADRAMNSLSSRPLAMTSRPTALARAMSLPTSRPSQTSAHSADEVRRGSIAYRRAPLWTPLST